MTQQEFCVKYKMTEAQFLGHEKIEGNLDLPSVKKLIPGFNPTVGGNLYLPSVQELIPGFNPTVGDYLDLRSVQELIPGFNPTVGDYLDLRSVQELIPGFNPTVGGDLYLRSVQELIPGFNPTVGGDLYLRSVQELIPGFNPTVGGNLYLRSGLSALTNICPPMLEWEGGKYVKVDGIFTEVVSRRGNVWRVKKIGSDKIFYLVSDGDGRYAHGDTLADAKEDLVYKLVDGANKEKYRGVSLETILSFAEAIQCYRVITRACSFGTRNFIETHKIERRGYSIAEIIELTKDQYRSDVFAKFFGK